MKYGKVITWTIVNHNLDVFDEQVNGQLRAIDDEGSELKALTFETLTDPVHGLTFVAHFVVKDGEYAG